MVQRLVTEHGVKVVDACPGLGVVRGSYYRFRKGPCRGMGRERPRPTPARALPLSERNDVLQVLNLERFQDQSPAQVYATLLDEGVYLCSERTMYRILAAQGQVRERRDQLRHPAYRKPELLATGPNQVWSWDITKLRGPVKWVSFHLYVILDVFSRYVVGWMVALREQARLAEELIDQSCRQQEIQRGQLTIHADRGTSMRSKTVALLLADLGIVPSFSRPHVSNDNPFSEAQFKTLKYRPDFPDRFGSLQDARAFCRTFFGWYNREHRHSGIGLMTPEMVHYGISDQVRARRQKVLLAAYQAHPERFVHDAPVPPAVPKEVWINPPPGTRGWVQDAQ